MIEYQIEDVLTECVETTKRQHLNIREKIG